MKRYLLIICTIALGVGMGRSALACGPYGQIFAQMVLSEDAKTRDVAIVSLRDRGPRGLDLLFKTHGKLIEKFKKTVELPEKDRLIRSRLFRAIDRVAGQRNAAWSKLYWMTDLKKAKAYAKQINKPILSLKLLGRLDEEFSCANSRFFRTALYANKELSAQLRNNFVLHWSSERASVPKVTIEFSDGRKIERTITGNSAHYIMTPDGLVVDVLPGLYGPKVFQRELERVGKVAHLVAKMPAPERSKAIIAHHLKVTEDLTTGPRGLITLAPGNGATGRFPTAFVAAPLAVGKGEIELPVLRAIDIAELDSEYAPIWRTTIPRYVSDSKLDANSKSLMQFKLPAASRQGNAFEAVVAKFEKAMAEDSAQNEQSLRRRLHGWFVVGATGLNDLETINKRVYAELFKTPKEDPWLGLSSEDTFTALDDGGLCPAPSEDS